MKDFDKWMKEYREAREIKCPFCGQVQRNDDGQYPCSYHGSEDAIEFECDACGEKFYVEEKVERTYEVYKIK